MAEPPSKTDAAASNIPPGSQEKKKGRNWEAISTVIALVGLVGALFFNGIQVSDSADAQRATEHATELSRQATELGLLTQLQSLLNDSVYARTPYARTFQALRAGRITRLEAKPYQAVTREASNMDYLAWLFNQGYVAIPGADRLWGQLMVCEFQDAIYPALPHAAQDYPNLVALHHGAADNSQTGCCAL